MVMLGNCGGKKMKNVMKIIAVVTIVIVLCGGFVIIHNHPLIWTMHGNSNQSEKWIDITIPAHKVPLNILGQSDYMIIHAIEPYNPQTVPLYKGIINPGDSINEFYGDVLSEKNNVTSEQDAPDIAQSAMAQHGGLPWDAELGFVKTSYAEKRNSDTGEILERWPTHTVVVYWKKPISGIPIIGQNDKLAVVLGENGEVLQIFKIWRTLEYTGRNVSIIPPNKAIEKLQNGESLYRPMADESITITNISLGYYEKSMTEPQIFLEPVWMFAGSTTQGDQVEFYVYARQFASFTATPTYGKAPLTVTFTDTSDASPIRWNWDFGDGIISAEQNPVHTYTTAGSYTVTLKAWNDLGSDTMTKTSQILIGKKAVVMQTGTKLDELIATLNTMNLDKGIKNSLVQKIGNAKGKNGDALKFIDQTKEKQANDMLTAEDNQMNAFMNDVKAQTGKAITTVDAATLNSWATEIRGLIQEAVATPI
jgi:PKD repeat protein